MRETDVLGQLKELPPIIIDADDIQLVPKHKRVNYVLTNYLKGGDTIAKTSLLKYFVNSVVGVVENINTNPVLKLYLGLLKSGMSIFELNTIFNNIVRPTNNIKNIPSRHEVNNKIILDSFGKEGDSLYTSDLGREYDILKEYIFEITEKTCSEHNITVLLRDAHSTEFITRRIIIIQMNGEIAAISEEKFMAYDDIVTDSIIHMICGKDESDNGSLKLAKLLTELNTLVLQIFYDKINPEINYVVIDNEGYHIQQKKVIEEDILNIDFPGLVRSMDYCLDNGMKRGYMLIGLPGVGKSTTIHKIANEFKNVPTFIIKNERLTSSSDVKRVFDMVRPFKAIMVIDDFDGLEIEGKNGITNEFLYQMDINGGYCGIIIAAVNDPSKVNYTLVNRPGRFDEVHLMKIPSNKEEVLYVLNSRLVKIDKKMSDFLEGELSSILYNEFIGICIENNFTHARISGIIDYCLCHFDEITLTNLVLSLNTLIEFSNNSQLMFDGNELVNKRNANIKKQMNDSAVSIRLTRGDSIGEPTFRKLSSQDEEDDERYEEASAPSGYANIPYSKPSIRR